MPAARATHSGLICNQPMCGRYVSRDQASIERGALEYWSKTLETEPEKIRLAVRKVGPVLDAVKTELGIGGVG